MPRDETTAISRKERVVRRERGCLRESGSSCARRRGRQVSAGDSGNRIVDRIAVRKGCEMESGVIEVK